MAFRAGSILSKVLAVVAAAIAGAGVGFGLGYAYAGVFMPNAELESVVPPVVGAGIGLVAGGSIAIAAMRKARGDQEATR